MKPPLSNIDAAYKDMTDGHACPLMGFTWGLAGVHASDDTALKKKITDHYKAWFNLARCHGSDSYVVLPGRDYADESYYRSNIRNHTTASVAFIYGFSTPKLRIHGRDGRAVKTGRDDRLPEASGPNASKKGEEDRPRRVARTEAVAAGDAKLRARPFLEKAGPAADEVRAVFQ